jgi:hypothetical protein
MKYASLFAGTALLAAAFALPVAPALAEYPDRPVSFVVPFPPGDLEDVLTRMIAEDFEAEYGVAAAVVNRPSDGGPFPGAPQPSQPHPRMDTPSAPSSWISPWWGPRSACRVSIPTRSSLSGFS